MIWGNGAKCPWREGGSWALGRDQVEPRAAPGGSDSGRSTTSPAHPSSCLSIESSRSVPSSSVELLIANASITTNEWRGARRFTRRTSHAAVWLLRDGSGRTADRERSSTWDPLAQVMPPFVGAAERLSMPCRPRRGRSRQQDPAGPCRYRSQVRPHGRTAHRSVSWLARPPLSATPCQRRRPSMWKPP